ncbi:MAG TPA: deoxyguanosinetriphosphate triphosphohydrolase [Roseiarcus sp.]|nr:deoxyguanosinetriphosphate triphosphohydrolase [Roseiarcus sp.]
MDGSSAKRAPYAADPAASRGRVVPEPPSPTRTDFQRDRDRIIHSTAFRRLAHKTQVFVYHEGDHFRTRLTHTIEVSQIARALARALRLDEDLAEAVALGHDLGHTPFGHTGEDALDACLAPYGGFDHNSHGLKIVTELERRYADFNGLNLTFETIEGLVKHNGPFLDAGGAPLGRWRRRGVPPAILAYDRLRDLELAHYASLEAQAAAIADDIAYDAHDIDDGLRAGLFDFAAARQAPFIAALLDEIERLHPGLEKSRVTHELTRRLITRFIEDAIAESRARIRDAHILSLEDVRAAAKPLVGFSPLLAEAAEAIKAFLFANMYRHPSVARVRDKAERLVRQLFAAFFAEPAKMPAEWAQLTAEAEMREGEAGRAQAVADYIAGMTDRYAVAEHGRLFDEAPDLR